MAPPIERCRACSTPLEVCILDLGQQPLADALLAPGAFAEPEPSGPLRLEVCSRCWLVQLGHALNPEATLDHGHGAAFSSTVLEHDREWADQLLARLALAPGTRVLDVAADDDHLLRPFAERGLSVASLRPADVASDVASELAAAQPADLVLVNHALAHRDDLNAYLAMLNAVLAPGGTIAIAFHHVLGVVQRAQFDVVCHAHATYLSVLALEAALARHDLVVVDAEEVPLHGGSIRVLVRRAADGVARAQSVDALMRSEREAGLDRLETYKQIDVLAQHAMRELWAFLETARSEGGNVVGYGAPTRGVTLLNACGVTVQDIPFTVDRSPGKQGRYLPGSRIPVLAPSAIDHARPDYVLILPWALADEIVEQLARVRSWGGRFVVALPALRVLD